MTNHISEEEGEPKRNLTEARLHTNRTDKPNRLTIKCGSNRSRPYAPPSRPMGKLFGCHYCENSLPKKSEKTTTTTKETPYYNIAKLIQPRFMAQVKAVVN